jgi:hypothetical protein
MMRVPYIEVIMEGRIIYQKQDFHKLENCWVSTRSLSLYSSEQRRLYMLCVWSKKLQLLCNEQRRLYMLCVWSKKIVYIVSMSKFSYMHMYRNMTSSIFLSTVCMNKMKLLYSSLAFQCKVMAGCFIFLHSCVLCRQFQTITSPHIFDPMTTPFILFPPLLCPNYLL